MENNVVDPTPKKRPSWPIWAGLGVLALLIAVLFVTLLIPSAQRYVQSGSAPSSPTLSTTTPPSTSSAATSAPAPAEVPQGPYLAGALDVQFPAGDPGVVSVVAQGPRNSGGYGTQWPIVVKNNTGGAVCDVEGTVTATSGGKLVGSNDVHTLAPAMVADGGVAFGSAYFDTQIPADAVVEFTFTTDTPGSCWHKPAVIDEVNVVPSGRGVSLVGRIHAEGKKISGPIGIDVVCMDGNGQPVAGGTSVEFADQDELAPGQAGTFTISTPGDGPCDQYLLAASGFGF